MTEETKLISYTTSPDLAAQFPEFQNIRLYGCQTEPLFIAQDILKFVGIKKFRFNEDFLERDMTKILVRHDDKQYIHVAFTERGLYKAILKSKTDLAEKFYDFIYIVMKELRTSGHVELSAAINKLHLYEKQMDNEHQLMQKYQGESERYYLKYNSMWMENQVLKDKVNNELENKKDPTYQIQSFKERFFKRVYVYVSKPPKPVEDEFETWDPDVDPTEDEEICFSISSKKRVVGSTAEMYLDPLVTFSQLKEKLAELEFSVKLTNERTHDTIFRGTLENLRNIIDDLST